MLYCNKCGLRLEPEESICSRCRQNIETNPDSEPISKIIYCKKCGQELQPDWKFCPICEMQIHANQKLETDYKPEIGGPNPVKGLCFLIFGIIFTWYWVYFLIDSYNLRFYIISEFGNFGLYAAVIVGSAMMIGFGFLIIIGGVYSIRKELNYFKE